MRSASNDFSTEVLIEMSESFLDDTVSSIVKTDAITKVPIVGIIAAFTKGVLSFRDRRYISKLLAFLAETSKATDEDRRQYSQKLDNDPVESKKAGATILDVIDKITSTEKATLIGKVFRAYMKEPDFSVSQLVLLCEMIEKAYLKDLLALINSGRDAPSRWSDVNLENVGIKKPLRAGDINRALENAIKTSNADSGVIRSTPLNRAFNRPEVKESGFTPEGSDLVRILRNY